MSKESVESQVSKGARIETSGGMIAKELIAVAEDHAKCGSIRSALVNLIQAVAKLEDRIATPTIEESSTVAPDPGEGWRGINKERDEPQEGDEMWMPGDLRWEKRWYPTVGFSPVCHYRRRIEAAPPNVAELPEGLPPLPEGAVYLGQGGTFNRNNGLFEGWECSGKQWWRGKHEGDDERCHYAAPADSEVARLNGLGEPEDLALTLVSEERDRLFEQLAELRDWTAEQDTRLKLQQDKIATLTKERDALREELNVERMRINAIREAIGSFNNVIHMTNAAKKEASNG